MRQCSIKKVPLQEYNLILFLKPEAPPDQPLMTTKPPAKRDDIYGSKTYWRELGKSVSKQEHYEKSLQFYDLAIKTTPDDRRALQARSNSRAKSNQIKGAQEDINKALELDPDYLPALHDKAHITYISCEFENALKQNSRLLKSRRKPDYFHIGKMTADATIENCLGESAGKPLRDHYGIIRKLAWKSNHEAEKQLQPMPRGKKELKRKKHKHHLLQNTIREAVTHKKANEPHKTNDSEEVNSVVDSLNSKKDEKYAIPKLHESDSFTPLQKYTTNIKNYMAEKYLEKMYEDKVFLKDIQRHRGMNCPNKAGSEKLMSLATAALSDVEKKQEILRARRPFYHIKYQEGNLSGTLECRQKEELMLHQQTIRREADKLLSKLRDVYIARNLNGILEVADKLKSFCDSKPKRLIPNKDEYMHEIYEKIRKGFYQQNRLNMNLFRWDQDKRICVSFGLPISREPSKDSVICQFENKTTDFKTLIALYENRLENAEEVDEICWYYHELSRFNMEIKQFEHARTYAKKCCNEAKTAGISEWILNGQMLLVRIHMRQQNKEDAVLGLNAAAEVAAQLNDKRLKDYLARCRLVIADLNFELETDAAKIKNRERHIMCLMKNDMVRNELAHLFRTMAALPANRRMSVMPGVRVNDRGNKEAKGVGGKQTNQPVTTRISHVRSVASKKSTKAVGWGEDSEEDHSKLIESLQLYM